MRFRMLMISKAYEHARPGTMPAREAVAAKANDNEALQNPGVLLALDGLQPLGSRMRFSGGKPKVIDRPFTDAKEMLGGYRMIQVKSKLEVEKQIRILGEGK